MERSTKKIQDEFTDLPITPQRKWQLRNPDKRAVIDARTYQNNREHRLEYARRRYQEKKAATNDAKPKGETK